ncbi:MAG: phospholipid carrier-dependent glycosyltransferase, partial [bacterium]
MRLLHVVALIVILGVSAALRFYGSPLYHPDEHYVVVQAHYMPHSKFRPTNFNYPSFYPTILAVVYKYMPNLGKGLIGKRIYPEDALKNTPFYQMQARFITALLGTFTVFLVYLIGNSLGWPYAGLAGAAFLAVSLNHVENSHFATVDVPMTFNATLAFLFSCLHYRSGRPAWALLGGVFCGITIGTKYNAAPILLPLLFSTICVAVRKRTFRAWWAVIGGMAIVPLGFLIANPYFPIIPMSYIEKLRSQMRVYSGRFPGYDDFIGPSNWIWNAAYLARAGMGLLPMILAVLGAIMLIISQKCKGILIVCFPLFYYAFISSQS